MLFDDLLKINIMKRLLMCALLCTSVLGIAQVKKKKGYKYKKRPKVVRVIPATVHAKSEPTIKEDEKIEVVAETEPIVDSTTEEIKEEPIVVDNTSEIIEKLSNKKGFISHRNSIYVRGIEAFIKGIYANNDKVYIMIELENNTNIKYDIESTSFVTTLADKKKAKEVIQEEKIFVPVKSSQGESLNPKTRYKVIYAFEKFTIAEDVNLIFSMEEENGDRNIKLPISSKYFIKAEYIK